MRQQREYRTSKVKLSIKLRKLLYVASGWALVGVFLSLVEYLIVSGNSLSNESFDLSRELWRNLMMVGIGTLTVGALEVFYFKDRFRKKPFGAAILLRSGYYTLSIILISGLVYCGFSHIAQNEPFTLPHLLSDARAYWLSHEMFLNLFSWGPVVAFTLFMLQVRDKYGPGVLSAFLRGKYYKPREESRIFMFLDLKGSTNIAERLGHVQYFNFLRDFFDDITYSILYHKGEIYQYVGDEVVISWKVRNGLKGQNAVEAYFDMQRTIKKLSDKYLGLYGIVPQFKAGIHYGDVTTGEIGVIKKDLIFTGDTLNTTSRIQEMCNLFETEILVSGELVDLMNLRHHYQVKEIGIMPVRGREEPVHLFTLSEMPTPLAAPGQRDRVMA